MVGKMFIAVTPNGRIQRMLLYAVIAGLTSLIPSLSTDDLITVRQGIVIGLEAALAMAIAIRAYIDQSPATLKDTGENQGE